ncbi:hypothetical protein HDU79_003436 [Rhizoclosmatium sp. JEL0117]|nr:hypothetical protein HDU79_003436 [Rhizoclosmatium sp. JEL0117]
MFRIPRIASHLPKPLRLCGTAIRAAPTASITTTTQASTRIIGRSLTSDAKRALDSVAAAYKERISQPGSGVSVAQKAKKKTLRSVGAVEKVEEVEEEGVARKQVETHRTSAFSTAESYDFPALLSILEDKYALLPFIADDVYHIRMSPQSEAFFFTNGVLVTWGASDAEIEDLLCVATEVGIGKYKDLEVEWFDYTIDPEHNGGIQNDTIVISTSLPPDQQKLAYSSGLARSAKLASLETLLESHLDKTRPIPTLLLQGKPLPLSRHAILKSLGELFSLRGNLNLHQELLDLPDFCWSSPRMEHLFHEISKNLDVRARIAIFNKKLDYANELAEVLRNHLHEEHSLKLEWAIIVLISVEIAFEVVHYWEKMKDREEEEREEREELKRWGLVLERRRLALEAREAEKKSQIDEVAA